MTSAPPIPGPGRTAIIVPAHNEEGVIGATLDSIAAAHDLSDVYVFCDACTDGTAEIARTFLPAANVIDHRVNIGKSRGLQYVVEHIIVPAGYDYVAVIDADTTIRPDFFRRAIPILQREGVAAVTGQVKSRRYANPFAVYRTFVYAIWQAVFKRTQSFLGSVIIASGCSTVWKVDVLDRLDFDHRMSTEDFSLTIQVHRRRLGAIRYASDAVVWTQDPFGLRAYYRQSYRWSRAFWESMRRYRVGFCWIGIRRKPLRPSLLDISALLLLALVFSYALALFVTPLLIVRPVAIDAGFLTLDTRSEYALWLGMQYTLVASLVFLVGVEARRPSMVFYSPLIIALIYLDILIATLALLDVTRSLYRRGSTETSAWRSPARQPISSRDLAS
jgi:poly-beta-1,6-N-acetyl-D-glucosamine synthase